MLSVSHTFGWNRLLPKTASQARKSSSKPPGREAQAMLMPFSPIQRFVSDSEGRGHGISEGQGHGIKEGQGGHGIREGAAGK
eukprot:1078703-Pelagomonas_calceolata.AAC.1